MILEIRSAPPFMTNGFVLGCADTREGVIIDPGDCIEDLIETATSLRLSIKYILLTHAHLDHVTGVNRAKAAFHAPVGLHRDDRPLYDAVVEQGQLFGLRVQRQQAVDFFYETGAAATPYAFGGYEIRVHHTPGHSPGGVCLQVGPTGEPGRTLIVGDTLFEGSIGRVDLPGGDLDVLLRSIRTVLFPLGDESVVYPGHGERTTIGRERKTNPFLTGRYS